MKFTKSQLLTMLIAASMLFLISCTSSNVETGPKQTDPFIGGNGGISMSFVGGMPPDYVFDNSGYNFGVGIRLDNLGESDVLLSDAFIELTGINPIDFGKASQAEFTKTLFNDLRGAKKNFDGTVLPGGTDIVEFTDLNYVPDLHGNTGVKIRADLCYKYTTYTSTQICIKRDILQNIAEDNKICDLSGQKDPKNSGAPVHITELKEDPAGENKIQITFVVDHVGSDRDEIFKDTSADCHDVVTNTDKNMVHVKVTSDVDGALANCMGLMEPANGGSEGYIKLFEDESDNVVPRTVTCTIDVSAVDSIYEELFQVELSYKYLQFIETPLEIRDVSTS